MVCAGGRNPVASRKQNEQAVVSLRLDTDVLGSAREARHHDRVRLVGARSAPANRDSTAGVAGGEDVSNAFGILSEGGRLMRANISGEIAGRIDGAPESRQIQ